MNDTVNTIAPIRQSFFIFVIKLFCSLFLIDTLYAVMGLLVLQFGIPQDYHYNLFIIFIIVHVLKNLLQMYIALKVVFGWVSRVWYIHGKQLIKREGILHMQETVYDLSIIRSIDIDQDFLGKLLHYGSIDLTTSASGGYNEHIILKDISEPETCAEAVKKNLSFSN